MLSLLSPARDKNVAFAAIQAGADAIYIGAPAFGAREKAGNSIEDLAEVVRYAHTYGVQVLVTVNTLLHDDEYPQAVKMIPNAITALRNKWPDCGTWVSNGLS